MKASPSVIFLITFETALLAVFIYPMLRGIINVGNIFAALFLAAAILAAVFRGRIKALWQKRAGKAVISAVGGFLALCLVYAAVLSALMISTALNTSNNYKTIILLGCQVHSDGQISEMLEARLEKAYEYLTANTDCVCIVSGGQGTDEPVSEADTMRAFLVGKGIDENRIFTESKSDNTDENIAFSYAIIHENKLDENIGIVTDAFHELRASIIAEKNGISVGAVPAETPLWLLPTFWVREWLALSEKLVLG